MFFIYASEEAIGFLYQKLTMETADILSGLQISISGGGNPVSFALQTLLYSMATLLPGTISGYVQGSIGKLMGDSLRIAVTSPLFTGRWGVALADHSHRGGAGDTVYQSVALDDRCILLLLCSD